MPFVDGGVGIFSFTYQSYSEYVLSHWNWNQPDPKKKAEALRKINSDLASEMIVAEQLKNAGVVRSLVYLQDADGLLHSITERMDTDLFDATNGSEELSASQCQLLYTVLQF